METAPRSEVVWLLCSDGGEREASYGRGALWQINGERGSVIDISITPRPVALAALRWRPA